MLKEVKHAVKWYVRKAAETYAWTVYFQGYNKQ